LIHHNRAGQRALMNAGSYALQSFLLSGHDGDDETDHLLGAHMTALMASQSAERYLELIHVASGMLGVGAQKNNTLFRHRESPLDGRAVDGRAEFEALYLKAWITGALGRQDRDKGLLIEALKIYEMLLAPGADVHSACCGLEGALIAANAAQLALTAFELSGRNPERLLEADEYCARARSKLDQELDPETLPELYKDIQLLAVRIRRILAVHDRSLPGLLKAKVLLDQVGVTAGLNGVSSRSATSVIAASALEEGRIFQARAVISGDNALRREAMGAYSRVHLILNSEQGRQRSLMRDATLGLAQCLFTLGQIEGSEKPFRKAIKIIDEALLANPDKVARGGAISRRSSHASRLLDGKLTLLKAEALGALGLHCDKVEDVETALLHLQNFAQKFEIELPDDTAKRVQLILIRLLLDRAEMTDLTLHYNEAVDAIRARGDEPGLTSAPTGRQDGMLENWRIEHGYARALSILAERSPSAAIFSMAEVQAWKLRDRAIIKRNELHGAVAEEMLGRVLAQKSDSVAGGDIGALADAVNAMRRALDLTPRVEMPLAWGARQSALGGLLAKYGTASGEVEGLEAAVSAYEKSLGTDMGELGQDARATTLIDLGETLNLLSRRSGDKHHKEGAQAAFQRALDVGSFHNLPLQAERAEAALSRLRG